MDALIIECDGVDYKFTPAVKDIAGGLFFCLGDKQASNKPLAAKALQNLFACLSPEDCFALLRNNMKPLMDACADGKVCV